MEWAIATKEHVDLGANIIGSRVGYSDKGETSVFQYLGPMCFGIKLCG